MNKRLCDMTLDELWRLFPIYLTEHKAYWEDWFREEVEFLKTVLPTDTRYYHIGSTAIKGIMAKPIAPFPGADKMGGVIRAGY